MKNNIISHNSNDDDSPFPCNEEIYENLSQKVAEETPINLSIQCLKIAGKPLANN
jgi:hypothetical protein